MTYVLHLGLSAKGLQLRPDGTGTSLNYVADFGYPMYGLLQSRAQTWFAEYLRGLMNSGSLGMNCISNNTAPFLHIRLTDFDRSLSSVNASHGRQQTVAMICTTHQTIGRLFRIKTDISLLQIIELPERHTTQTASTRSNGGMAL